MDYRRALLSSPHERGHRRRQLRHSAVLYGAMACIAVVGPLLGLTVFTLLSSAALLLAASPVLLFFSPLLLFAASVISVALLGFGAADVMALTGLWAIKLSLSFLPRMNKAGTAVAPPVDGRWTSHASHEMELGASYSSSREPNRLEATPKNILGTRTKEIDVE